MAWRVFGIGWYIPLCLVGGAVAGWKLDERFGTEPWLALAGTSVGLSVALLGAFLMIWPLMKEEQPSNSEKDKEQE